MLLLEALEALQTSCEIWAVTSHGCFFLRKMETAIPLPPRIVEKFKWDNSFES